MNGVHDMGGMHGFGHVEIEENEPVFHADWEARVFALNQATKYLRMWNLDMVRYSAEIMPPVDYLAATYYLRWLWGLERRLIDHGLVSPEEMRTGQPMGPAGMAALTAEQVPRFLQLLDAAPEETDVPARHAVGDAVVARNIHPSGHTRLPRYVRGKPGTIHRDHGVFGFPDSLGMGGERRPQHCYSVRFTARDLWGSSSDRDSVYVDLWDDHLSHA